MEKEIPIQIQSGFFGYVSYFLLTVMCFVQEWTAKLFWFFFVKPALLVSRLIGGSRPATNPKTFVVLDCLKLSNKTLWNYLKTAFNINSWIGGVRSKYSLFDHLLAWNTQIPLIGYQLDKTTFTIELLFEEVDGGQARRCDLTWLSTHKRQGKFQILSKRILQNGSRQDVIIDCIWLSGPDVGKIFSVKKLPELGGNDSADPTSIYFPPGYILFLIEIVISATAILALVNLAKQGFEFLFKN